MKVVLDTNVIVSAFLRPEGPPGVVLDLAEMGAFTVLRDSRILAEYREVLSRPRFAFSAGAVADLRAFFAEKGELVAAPPLAIDLPDPDDLPFVEVAVAGKADALVTGNARHFPPGCSILSPAALIQRLAG